VHIAELLMTQPIFAGSFLAEISRPLCFKVERIQIAPNLIKTQPSHRHSQRVS